MKRNVLDYFEEYFCMGVLAFMTVLIFTQVVLRYCFASSISWSEELSRYLFIWISWIGASYCVKVDAHLRVTAVVGLVPEKYVPYVNMLMYLCWAAFALLLVVKGCDLIMLLIETNQRSSAMRMPMWIPIASVPVGSALMIYRILGKMKIAMGEILNRKEAAGHD